MKVGIFAMALVSDTIVQILGAPLHHYFISKCSNSVSLPFRMSALLNEGVLKAVSLARR